MKTSYEERCIALIQKIDKHPKRDTVWGIIKKLKCLRDECKLNNKEIENVIQKMNLPFGMHLFIVGNFSNLMDCVGVRDER